MINYDSPIVQLIYILGIDLSKIDDFTNSDLIAIVLVAVFGLFVLHLFFKYFYRVISSFFRGDF